MKGLIHSVTLFILISFFALPLLASNNTFRFKSDSAKTSPIQFVGPPCKKHKTLGRRLKKCKPYACGEHRVRKLKKGACEYVQTFTIKTEYGEVKKSLSCKLDNKYRRAIAQELIDNAKYFNRLSTNKIFNDYEKGKVSKKLHPKRVYRIGRVKTKTPIAYATQKEVCVEKYQ